MRKSKDCSSEGVPSGGQCGKLNRFLLFPSDSSMDNNLNKSSTSPGEQYVKNIPTDEGSGDKDADRKMLEEMNCLIAQTARELEIDAKKAIADLAKDKELMERLKKLKDDEDKKGEI